MNRCKLINILKEVENFLKIKGNTILVDVAKKDKVDNGEKMFREMLFDIANAMKYFQDELEKELKKHAKV